MDAQPVRRFVADLEEKDQMTRDHVVGDGRGYPDALVGTANGIQLWSKR